MRWVVSLALGAMLAASTSAAAATQCDRLLARLADQVADASCAESTDLTTNNPATTPANNSLPGLPPCAFTPQTDRAVISPTAHTPITPPAPAFPQQLELIQPHAQKAFDLLVNYVERDVELPPDQCIPRGGEIAAAPTQPGHCAQLFVP
jgi:hypothetical protein